MQAPTTGAVIAGKYVLRRLLGQGGFGSVWEGENVDLGKRVAIKLLSPDRQGTGRQGTGRPGVAEAIARFRREARAAAKIESAQIVQVFDVGEDVERGLFMVMELLRGEDLRHRLDRSGRLDVDEATDFAHQIACGLAKAHAVGVVHRDLKPANVFLHQPQPEAGEDEARPIVKIVDFGVAKLLVGDEGEPADAGQPLTTAGKTMGTPQYMSPEQVQGAPYDHRGDLWALGVVLYEMLAGRAPFPVRVTFQETALGIVHDEPPKLASIAPWVPAPLARVVERALEKEPSRRFEDGLAFARALVSARPEAFPDGLAEAREATVAGARPIASSSGGAHETANDVARSAAPVTDPERPPTFVRRRRSAGRIVVAAVLALGVLVLSLAALRSVRHDRGLAPSAPASADPAPAPSPTPPPSPTPTPSPTPSPAPSPKAKPVPPLAAVSSSAPAATSSAPAEPQFGGVGVSESY